MSYMLELPSEISLHFYTLESLLCNKGTVRETLSCMVFHEQEVDETNIVNAEIVKIRENFKKDKWWKGVGSTYHVMINAMYAIRRMDHGVANVSEVQMTWWIAQGSLGKYPSQASSSRFYQHLLHTLTQYGKPFRP